LTRFFQASEVARLEIWMPCRNSVSVAILHNFPLRQRRQYCGAQHTFRPIAHRPVGKKFGTRIGRHPCFLGRFWTFPAKGKAMPLNTFGGEFLNDALQGGC